MARVLCDAAPGRAAEEPVIDVLPFAVVLRAVADRNGENFPLMCFFRSAPLRWRSSDDPALRTVRLISTDQPFLIQSLDDRVVEAWAQQRLKFDPKLWMKEYRDELRSALRELTAGDNEGLYAAYCSPQRDLCDCLLYTSDAADE